MLNVAETNWEFAYTLSNYCTLANILKMLLCQRFPLGTPLYALYITLTNYHDIPNIFFEDCGSHNSTPFHKQNIYYI